MIPIPDALEIVRVALYAALAPLCGTYHGHAKAYWMVAEQGVPLPLLLMQSQDGGGQDASYIGHGGWRGEIAIRALASSPSAAAAALADVPAALEALAHPTGYTIRATFLRPLALPPREGVWAAGHLYTIHLYRA